MPKLARTPIERKAVWRQHDKHLLRAAQLQVDLDELDPADEEDKQEIAFLELDIQKEQAAAEELLKQLPEVYYSTH
jgi:hypothetical protein